MTNEFDIETTCAFTGHRILKKDFNYEKLKDIIKKTIKKGYKTFLIGMAKGFDMKCFETLLSLNNENIEIVACIPCKSQSDGYSLKDKERYKNLLEKADKIIYISEEYVNGCMQMRNRFMVDNSSLIIAYLYINKGGTYYTVNYAKKKGKEILSYEEEL